MLLATTFGFSSFTLLGGQYNGMQKKLSLLLTAVLHAGLDACSNFAGWEGTGRHGSKCKDYETCKDGGWKNQGDGYYTQYAMNGVSARTACCNCGGGTKIEGMHTVLSFALEHRNNLIFDLPFS